METLVVCILVLGAVAIIWNMERKLRKAEKEADEADKKMEEEFKKWLNRLK